jgi:hypothetical protein
MHTSKSVIGSLLGLLALIVFDASCGGVSDAEKQLGCNTPNSVGGSGGVTSTGGSFATGGSFGTGGAPQGTGGSTPPGTGGATQSTGGSGGGGVPPDAGAPMDGPPSSGCPALSSLTLSVHIIMDATWPAGTATSAGSGKIHLWNLTKLAASNGNLSGDETRSCGTILPDFSLNGAGQLVTGGSKVLVEIPHSVWEAPTIPKLQSRGKLASWDVGSAFTIDNTIALFGLTMPDPLAAWPNSYTAIMAVDADGDGKPGFLAMPRAGMGYVQPPTGLGLFGSAPSADKLYLSSRTVVSLEGKLTGCSEVAGTAKITFFDSHVVGCHVKNGGECSASQTDFVDQSRTLYKITGASFTAKKIPDNASCADARAALPM